MPLLSSVRLASHAGHDLRADRCAQLYSGVCVEAKRDGFPEDQVVWLVWLETVTSFAFRGMCGNLNVYQEARRRGGRYWYAYATTGPRTRKRYLGPTARVTFARLEEVAKALASESSPTPLAPERGPDERDGVPHQAWPGPAREVSHEMELLATRLSHPVLSSRLLAREGAHKAYSHPPALSCKITRKNYPMG